MPKTARDVMSPNAECVGENETLLDAAKKLAARGYGSMPICGEDNRLKGMLTDRDIVVKALAQGKDPASTRAGELGEGKPVTIGADDSLREALKTMAQYKVRRLPATAATSWSPPMPMWRWMRHIGMVRPCSRNARYQAMA